MLQIPNEVNNPYENPFNQPNVNAYGANPNYEYGQYGNMGQFNSPFGVQEGVGKRKRLRFLPSMQHITFSGKKRQMPSRFNQVGMVIDPYLLDNITRDIQAGYNGARGFRVQHAFIVTWERMAFGGAAKAVDVSQFNEVKQWVRTNVCTESTTQIFSCSKTPINW